MQQDGANVDLILVISISSVLRLWFGNPLNVVEESDNEDELIRRTLINKLLL